MATSTSARGKEPSPARTGSGAVVVTKLRPPASRPRLVPRAALVERLAADGAKLTLVAAPAGWGKTTLLAAWAQREEARRFAWLAVDRWDNDPVRFWTYVIEAFETREAGVGAEALALLGAPGAPVRESALPALVNALEPVAHGLTLVLDDYHLVDNAEVHEDVAYLLDRLPPGLGVVVSTRSDPPLPLERMRGRGELAEVRADDLRFTPEEAATFLNDVLGLRLAAADVARLHERTEGWAAGLYLAALSLRGRDDPSAFIEAFAGDDRHVVDYLSAEVLHGQPEDVRRFMLETAILDRLSGPLCDAVTAGARSAKMLRRIEAANLFLVPLDNRREWYRYHHLFGRLLLHELRQAEPGLVLELHRRAAAWYAAEAALPEAVHHAFGGEDVDGAAGLVAEGWSAYFNRGRLETVARWLDSLGDKVVAADPRLAAAAAWLALDLGRMDDVERWIDAAEGLPDAAVLRAVYLFKSGDVGGAAAVAEVVVEDAPAEAVFPRTVAHCILGITAFWSGDLGRAARLLGHAAELARSSANDLAACYSAGYAALIRAEAGELEEADELAAAAIRRSEEARFAEHFVTMIAHLSRARAALARDDARAADEPASRAVALALRGAGRLETIAAQLTLAEVARRLGRDAEAEPLVRAARSALSACPDPRLVRREVAAAERRLGRARPRPAAAVGDELTSRELEILRLLDSELSQREIGARLFVSLNTVKTHTRGIFRKLDASNREEAVGRARALGLL
jgi:LuxR family transcriptional regulator, maltose regulon positive regulatory protein